MCISYATSAHYSKTITKPMIPAIQVQAMSWCLLAPEAITGVDGASAG